MEDGQTSGLGATEAGTRTSNSSEPESASRSAQLTAYHPSAAFRRALNREAHSRRPGAEPEPSSTGATDGLGHAPGILSLLGAGLAVGATAGFLELSVQAAQIHGLHRVDWSSLTISRHAGWMVVVTSTLLSAEFDTPTSWRRHWPGRRGGRGGKCRSTDCPGRGTWPERSWARCCCSAHCKRSRGYTPRRPCRSRWAPVFDVDAGWSGARPRGSALLAG